jgi:ABC-type dipeptide/oligopeptide/nickel transport system permease subunit
VKRSVRLALGIICIVLLAAIFAPLLVSALGLPGPNIRDTSALSAAFGTPTGPGAGHPLGVDGLGRDVLSRTIYGARVAMLVAIPAALLTILLGTALGLLAGLRGGAVGWTISRLAEAFLIIPYLVLAAGIASSCSVGEGCAGGTLKPGIPLVVLVIVAASWPIVTWIVRNQSATLRRADFVQAAQAAGLSTPRVLVSEVLPNLSGPIAVFFAILIPQAVLAEAALTFMGIGVETTTPSWGAMISAGASSFPDAWWYLVAPGVALLVTVVSFAVLAEALRDEDPKAERGLRREALIR